MIEIDHKVVMETAKTQGDRRNLDGEITLVPDRIVLRGSAEASILRTLQENSVLIGCSCGEAGRCGECRIRFVEQAPHPTSNDQENLSIDQISQGWRLACQHDTGVGLSIEIYAESGELNHKELDEEFDVETILNPEIRQCKITFGPISREERRSRAIQVAEALERDLRIPIPVLQQLSNPDITRFETLSVITDDEQILEVRTETNETVYGLAIDIGTTTLAVHLFDLETGVQLAVAAGRNPQRRFGADVISRIAHIRRETSDGLIDLHKAVVEGLNELIDRVAVQRSISPESIYATVVVGNPTMLHLFLSVNPIGIDVSPYVSTFTRAVRTRAGTVGIAANPEAVIQTLPAISAYVGADTVAGIIATQLHRTEDSTLFLDVGTNGEIVLAINGRLVACSTAAGPAFEGASLVQGMPALHGAIESVRIHEGEIHLEVVGDCVATGICGTGLLSAVAECLRVGAIDASGRICSDGSPLANRIDGDGKTRRIRLTDVGTPVYLYQNDIREFQLAKAAIRAGIERLLQQTDLRASDLDRILVGGAFSARLSSDQLIETGFLPHVDPCKIHVVGNVAGQGARQVLLNCDLMQDAEDISRCVEYLELSRDARFAEQYVDYIPFRQ